MYCREAKMCTTMLLHHCNFHIFATKLLRSRCCFHSDFHIVASICNFHILPSTFLLLCYCFHIALSTLSFSLYFFHIVASIVLLEPHCCLVLLLPHCCFQVVVSKWPLLRSPFHINCCFHTVTSALLFSCCCFEPH